MLVRNNVSVPIYMGCCTKNMERNSEIFMILLHQKEEKTDHIDYKAVDGSLTRQNVFF